MKAVQFASYGGPEVLQLVDVEEPHPGPGQVRIAVRAAGVNGIDWKIREGYMKDVRPLVLPSGTGMDAAGVVDEVGGGLAGVDLGDEVFGTGSATYAEHAVLSVWTGKPAGLSFEEAAGYPVPAETAIRIIDQVGVRPGQTLLVSGASGGVGSAAVQVARDRGIDVIATASEANQEYLRSMGATPTIYGDGLVDRVRALAPGGVDAALDIAGSGVIPELIELTGEPSKVLSIADFAAPQHGAQVSSGGDNATAAFEEAARLFRDGRFRLPVARTFSLSEAGEAQAESASGHVRGRLIIAVS
ncbi:MAG TPA: NADP-dependent oxidoreductase [Candidatus Dormibacteraeota bacterium]|jgi:NADPH:quinone reductase-like Zn-dependent oxidoreductase|nr:NADP-dependent oxidoreductase [Candidatus Dormibacteraeota bacterium]